jgi:26S proteasome regulatory subunit N2
MGACIGTLYFTHYWYWFSSIHFLSLALSPSALIGVDKDLEVPSGFQFQSNSKASLFGYPKMVDRSKEEEVKREQKVQLSTTMKVNKR